MRGSIQSLGKEYGIMNKDMFLKELQDSLSGLSEADKKEIVSDYEEHFRAGGEQGKTEKNVARALGNPRSIARQFKADYSIKQAERTPSTPNIIRAVLATLSLGFFNIIFVLGPFFGLVGILAGLFGVAIGLVAGGGAILIGTAFPSLIFVTFDPLFAIFTGIGSVALGSLLFIGCCYLTTCFYRVTLTYLKWNIRIVQNDGEEK